MTIAEPLKSTNWWGKFELEEGELGHWCVGPLELWIRRANQDWRYGSKRSENPVENRLQVDVPWNSRGSERALPEEEARFGVAKTGSTIELAPLLADRPVVARPAVPFFVPPGEKVDVFLSTPLWVQLRVGKSALAEVPCFRPSDTWFGSNTRGELSYSSRTHLRRNLANVEHRPHRAISCLSIENNAKENLALERLSLPVPQLSIFASPTGSLWTEHVSVRNEEDGDLSEVSLGKGPPREAGNGKLIAPPRSPLGRSFGSLIFGGLFEVGN